MKRGWILVIGGVVLFLFILGTSYAWYQFFRDDDTVLANLEIKIEDNGKGVVITDALPISDIEGKKIEPYRFAVENKGAASGNYRLLIQETPFNEINDGCTEKDLLDRSQLRYQLLMNGNEIALGDLELVKNNILELRTIDITKKNSYELRVWVKESAFDTEWKDKHYHYSVVIVPISGEEELN